MSNGFGSPSSSVRSLQHTSLPSKYEYVTLGNGSSVHIEEPIIFFFELPMPPSANDQLTRSKNYKGFIKTAKARAYDQAIQDFYVRNRVSISKARSLILEIIASNHLLACDFDFMFPRTSLIGQKGQVKRLDCNNRIKASVDGVSHLLNIDDKFFWSHHVSKKIYVHDRLPSVVAKVYPIDPDNYGLSRKE